MQLPLVPAGLYVEPWPPVLAVRGQAALRPPHAHHAMHFVLALDGELRVRTSRAGRWTTVAGALTAPDHPHEMDSRGIDVLIVFFDPESDVGAAIQPALERPVRFITSTERAALVQGVEDPHAFVGAGIDGWAYRAASKPGRTPREPRRALHPAVRRLLVRLRESGVEEDTSLEGLADAVGLSPSRLMHVFTESVGIPLRPYLSWLRVQRAACAI